MPHDDRPSRYVGVFRFGRHRLPRRFAERRAIEPTNTRSAARAAAPPVAVPTARVAYPSPSCACVHNAMERPEVLSSVLHPRVGVLRNTPWGARLLCRRDARSSSPARGGPPTPPASSANRDPVPRCR